MKFFLRFVLAFSFISLTSSFITLHACQSKDWYVGKWADGNGQTLTITSSNTVLSSDGAFDGILMGFQYSDNGKLIFCDLCEEGTSEEEYNEDSGGYTLVHASFNKETLTLEFTEPNHGMLLSVYHKIQTQHSTEPNQVKTEEKTSVNAQQLIFEFALEEDDERIDTNMLPSILEYLKNGLKEEEGLIILSSIEEESVTWVAVGLLVYLKHVLQEKEGVIIKNGCIEESQAGYVFSLTFENEWKRIPDDLFYEVPFTRIELPDGIEHIGNGAFSRCDVLNIMLPNSITTIGNCAFMYCDALTSIILPNSLTTIGFSAFANCRSLTSITLPNSITTIRDYTFNECSSLTSITLPNSLTSIGERAFFGCDALTSITLPNSITTIREGAFAGCSALTSIVIPNSVTTIGEDAFAGCDALTSVVIPSSLTDIGEGAFPKTARIIRK